jgi:hypothetical protein
MVHMALDAAAKPPLAEAAIHGDAAEPARQDH